MTDSNLMNREELVRLAALDVFGLLDPYESDLFNRSFHNAPAAVQDEIVALQASIASDKSLLHDEEPAPDLRERVLERVASAVEAEAEALAPIPIYRRRKAQQERHEREARRHARSAAIWRAASFVLAACFVITLLLFFNASSRVERITDLALNARTQDELKSLIGDGFLEYVPNPNVTAIVLSSDIRTQRFAGSIYLNQRNGSVFLLTMGLPANKAYRLVARNAEGEAILESDEFVSNGAVASVRIDDIRNFNTILGAQWAVVDASTGRTLLSTTTRV